MTAQQERATLPEWAAQRTLTEARADSVRKAQLPEPTPQEAARPYAKYFFEEVTQPEPAHFARMDQPMSDPSKAFYPEDINRLLDVERLETDEVEIGWCHLPNGAGYIANKIFYPDVTADMIDWWFAWHPLEDLRYRLWYPPQHAGIMLSALDRARILDPSLPNSEKNWGVTHYVTEDCDAGMDNIDITFHHPADLGFDMTRFHDVISAFAGGCGWQRPVRATDETIPAPSIMCHVFYNVPGGLVHRTRFWMGYHLCAGGGAECLLPEGVQVPVVSVQGLARHNVKEFSRLGAILPRIYAEFGPGMTC